MRQATEVQFAGGPARAGRRKGCPGNDLTFV